MAYADLASELTGHIPGLSGFLADDFIKRAYRKILDVRPWSFLSTDDSVICPTALTAGTYNITKYSDQVTANATASSAFAALNGVVTPPQFMQFRFQGPTGPKSQVYNILSLDPTVPTAYVFTLDQVVSEATNAASPYLCYRPYIAAPSNDFLKWESVVDVANGIDLILDRTSHQFDMRDPSRSTVGLAYYVGAYKYSDDLPNMSSAPIYELWPGPTIGQSLTTRYRRRGVDFAAPSDVQNSIMPDDLIMQAALGFYAYPWASSNAGHFPAMKDANWLELIADAKNTYEKVLDDTKRVDDRGMVQSLTDHVSSMLEKP